MTLNVHNINTFAKGLNDWSLAGISVNNQNAIVYNSNTVAQIKAYVKDIFLKFIYWFRIIEWDPKKDVYIALEKSINELSQQEIWESKTSPQGVFEISKNLKKIESFFNKFLVTNYLAGYGICEKRKSYILSAIKRPMDCIYYLERDMEIKNQCMSFLKEFESTLNDLQASTSLFKQEYFLRNDTKAIHALNNIAKITKRGMSLNNSKTRLLKLCINLFKQFNKYNDQTQSRSEYLIKLENQVNVIKVLMHPIINSLNNTHKSLQKPIEKLNKANSRTHSSTKTLDKASSDLLISKYLHKALEKIENLEIFYATIYKNFETSNGKFELDKHSSISSNIDEPLLENTGSISPDNILATEFSALTTDDDIALKRPDICLCKQYVKKNINTLLEYAKYINEILNEHQISDLMTEYIMKIITEIIKSYSSSYKLMVNSLQVNLINEEKILNIFNTLIKDSKNSEQINITLSLLLGYLTEELGSNNRKKENMMSIQARIRNEFTEGIKRIKKITKRTPLKICINYDKADLIIESDLWEFFIKNFNERITFLSDSIKILNNLKTDFSIHSNKLAPDKIATLISKIKQIKNKFVKLRNTKPPQRIWII